MLRLFDILKKVETSVKFEKNSRNTEVPKLKILVGKVFKNLVALRKNLFRVSTVHVANPYLSFRDNRGRGKDWSEMAIVKRQGSEKDKVPV